MPHLLTGMPKLLALAGSVAFGAFLFVGSGEAAPPGQGLKGFAAPSPVEQADYYKRYDRTYPPYGVREYSADYGRYGYRRWRGSDEVRELQRLFPETNWPPSMRYHQY